MTTRCFDNKIWIFKILLSWRFLRKTALLDALPPKAAPPPPQKRFFFLIVVSPSLKSPEKSLRVRVFFLVVFRPGKIFFFLL